MAKHPRDFPFSFCGILQQYLHIWLLRRFPEDFCDYVVAIWSTSIHFLSRERNGDGCQRYCWFHSRSCFSNGFLLKLHVLCLQWFLSFPFLLDSVGVIVRIVSFGLTLSEWYSLMMTLFVVGSGSLWPSSHVADLHLLHMLVSCWKFRFSRSSSWRSASDPYFSDTDFASAFDSSILRTGGWRMSFPCISSTCFQRIYTSA